MNCQLDFLLFSSRKWQTHVSPYHEIHHKFGPFDVMLRRHDHHCGETSCRYRDLASFDNLSCQCSLNRRNIETGLRERNNDDLQVPGIFRCFRVPHPAPQPSSRSTPQPPIIGDDQAAPCSNCWRVTFQSQDVKPASISPALAFHWCAPGRR